jgi:iron complex outermembrane receptor protein
VGVSLARSTKLPNAEELYSDGPHVATQTFEIGDPTLDEETSLGLDVSLRRQSGRFTGELTLFANRFDDFIFQSLTGEEEDGLPVVRYAQADAELVGAELESRFELWHGGSGHLDLQLFGDYVEAELRATGEPLPRIPALRYGAGLHFHNDRLHGLLEARRTDAQDRLAANETPTDGFTFVNASVSYRFFDGSLIYDLLLRGRNLTDEEGRNHVSFLKDEVPLPGRDVSLALRLWF